jgi:multidrug resistance efflux pump
MKPIVKIIATGVIVLAAAGMIIYKYIDYVKYPWTRDGLVRAQVIEITPRVSGALVQVKVQNNQLVKKGDLLLEIDPSTFQATVDVASAQLDNMRDIVRSLGEQVGVMRSSLDSHQAELNQANFDIQATTAQEADARESLERAKELLKSGVGTARNVDNNTALYQTAVAQLNVSKARVDQATAGVAQAKDALARAIADLGVEGDLNPRLRRASADLEIARLNLGFTKVWAPTDGYVTNLQLSVGDSAVADHPAMALIDANSFYVQAFFRETFLADFKVGDRAVVTLMSYPDTPLEGSVESIGWGIAQQNGSSGYELLPSVSPTFEWIRLAQRIPVIVRIKKMPDNVKLRAGTTASVMVVAGTSADGNQVPPVPRPLQ